MTTKITFRELAKGTLAKLTATGTTRSLMESTLIAMVWSDFMTGGHDRKAFWKLEHTCSRSTWSRWIQKFPELTAVYVELVRLFKEQMSDKSLDAIEEAKLIIQLAAPDAARTAVTMLQSPDETARRHAAFGLLDRADGGTAPQNALQVPGLDDILTKIYGTDEDDEASDNSDS
jgi:hypothetical protein